jgi:hypothetical protein
LGYTTRVAIIGGPTIVQSCMAESSDQDDARWVGYAIVGHFPLIVKARHVKAKEMRQALTS